MKGVTSYVLRELAGATLYVTLVLAGVVWLSQSLRFVDLIINRGLSFLTFLHLTLLLVPVFLSLLLPIAVFCAVVYTYHRLTIDSELVVLRAIGLSQIDLAKPALILAAVVTVLCYAITLYLMPMGFREFKDRQFTIRGDYSHVLLQEGAFNTLGRGLTVYIRSRQPDGQIFGILVHDNREMSAPVTMMAERGALVRTQAGPRLVLFNGTRQEYDPGARKLGRLYFDEHSVDLTRFVEAQGPRWREPRERYLHELFGPPQSEDDKLQLTELRAEGHWRLVSPLFPLVFASIALAGLLGGEFSRRGRVPRMFVTAIVAIAFQGLALALANVIVKLPPLTPLLYVNIALWLAAAGYLLFRQPRPRRHPAASGTEPEAV